MISRTLTLNKIVKCVKRSGRHETPAGKATAKDPTGSAISRRLKRCPRKASACNRNQYLNLLLAVKRRLFHWLQARVRGKLSSLTVLLIAI
jgi:hypothetical protein